jgi:hypothetical protein
MTKTFWDRGPQPMAVVGSVSQNDLPGAVSAWPLQIRVQHEGKQAEATGRVHAASLDARNRDKAVKAAKLAYKLRRMGVLALPAPIPVALLKGKKTA